MSQNNIKLLAFWNEKGNRGKYYEIKTLQEKKINCEAKTILLKRCLCLNLVPVTLQVRNSAPGVAASQQRADRWKEAQLKGGMAMTRETLLVMMGECSRLRGEERRAVTEFEEWAGMETWPEIEVRLERDRRISYKQA